jgi:hypothetical protein
MEARSQRDRKTCREDWQVLAFFAWVRPVLHPNLFRDGLAHCTLAEVAAEMTGCSSLLHSRRSAKLDEGTEDDPVGVQQF